MTMLVEVLRRQFLTDEAACLTIIGGGPSTSLLTGSTRRRGSGRLLGAAPAPVPAVEDANAV